MVYDKKKIPHFDDLANIALVPYKKAIQINDCDDLERQFIAVLGEDIEKCAEDYYMEFGEKEAWKALDPIINKIGSPPKYACILVGDGDNMGKALDKIQTSEGHKEFSRGLAKFASSVESVIKDFEGSLIYSGGDDVMTYLPMHTALECSDEIRKTFSKSMQEIFEKLELKDMLKDESLPTFSIGLAIVHYSEPLDRALNLARQAERTAKEQGGRNALAIIQSKRSGTNQAIYGKWEGENGLSPFVDRLKVMCQLYEDKILSSTLGYQLREAGKFGGDNLNFTIEDGKIKPKNASSAMVLGIFEQKKETEILKENLLHGQKSINTLASELIISKQIASVKSLIKEGGKNEGSN